MPLQLRPRRILQQALLLLRAPFVKYLSAAPEGRYFSAQEAILPGPVYGDADSADAEYKLQRIVDRRTRYKKIEYLVEYGD